MATGPPRKIACLRLDTAVSSNAAVAGYFPAHSTLAAAYAGGNIAIRTTCGNTTCYLFTQFWCKMFIAQGKDSFRCYVVCKLHFNESVCLGLCFMFYSASSLLVTLYRLASFLLLHLDCKSIELKN
jgi:hypothetical protein